MKPSSVAAADAGCLSCFQNLGPEVLEEQPIRQPNSAASFARLANGRAQRPQCEQREHAVL